MVALDVQTHLAVAAWALHTREAEGSLSPKPPFPQLQKGGLGVDMHVLDHPQMGGGQRQGGS